MVFWRRKKSRANVAQCYKRPTLDITRAPAQRAWEDATRASGACRCYVAHQAQVKCTPATKYQL